jgi:hypothetical protein
MNNSKTVDIINVVTFSVGVSFFIVGIGISQIDTKKNEISKEQVAIISLPLIATGGVILLTNIINSTIQSSKNIKNKNKK